MRKYSSRRWPSLDACLPEACLPVDFIDRIGRHPRRIEILRRVLALNLFDQKALTASISRNPRTGNPLVDFLADNWDSVPPDNANHTLAVLLSNEFTAIENPGPVATTGTAAASIGIYNAYWNTCGGGEHHALRIARHLARYASVDLISETPFDLEKIAQTFDLDTNGCAARIVPRVDTALTAEYRVFLNCTHESTLPSAAPISCYIVSFPWRLSSTRSRNAAFLRSYRFLANSTYTQYWIARLWKHQADILAPCIPPSCTAPKSARKHTILSVGRFFLGGHNKKQAEMAAIFCRMKRERLLPEDWRLILIGNVNPPDLDYINTIRDSFASCGVEIHPNLDHARLSRFYSEASLYWHATGLGENTFRDPGKFEHFGISICEAMQHGCIPLIYAQGGMAEVITHGQDGFLFSTPKQLTKLTAGLVADTIVHQERIEKIRLAAQRTADRFSPEALGATLNKIIPQSRMNGA